MVDSLNYSYDYGELSNSQKGPKQSGFVGATNCGQQCWKVAPGLKKRGLRVYAPLLNLSII